MKKLVLFNTLLALATSLALADDPATDDGRGIGSATASGDAEIRAIGAAYEKAFNAHDADAVANFWSPDAVYTNRDTGEQVTGREAIAEQFTTIFKQNEKLKLELGVGSIQFISPNVAVEQGAGTLQNPGSAAEVIDYTAVYVRRDGHWLLDRVTDQAPQESNDSHFQQLQPLAWMIGDWVDADESTTIETSCDWTRNQNFISRRFKISVNGKIDMSGIQIVGWDAVQKQIRSWTFDSDGGFSEGIWTNKGDQWFVRKTGHLANGNVATATNIIREIDDDTRTVQSIQRTVDGKLLPNVDEVRVVRR